MAAVIAHPAPGRAFRLCATRRGTGARAKFARTFAAILFFRNRWGRTFWAFGRQRGLAVRLLDGKTRGLGCDFLSLAIILCATLFVVR